MLPFNYNRKKLALIIAVALLAVIIIGILVYNNSRNESDDAFVAGNGTAHSDANNGYLQPKKKSFSVGDHAVLVIKGHASDVSVHAGKVSSIIVVARRHSTDQGPNPNDTRILYDQSTDAQGHDHLTISTDPGFRDIDYDVTVPASTQAQVEVNSGSVSIDGIGGATVDTGSGSLDLEDIKGPLNAHTDSGDITVRQVTGDSVINGASGSLHITGVTGQLQAMTQSGDVVVQSATLRGQSVMKTNSGSVRFQGSLNPNGSYKMTTNSGDINLTLPNNAAFQLAASTGSGTVHNEFGADAVGSNPLAHITATIGSGSVSVNKQL
ncbi:DUF4097 family beta strand repeat-containing protein [Dictyobacter arantiisoli]|uniref:DUF4097 domain-containing protein n=1 Tax=Dictyobacter arantiisoli TaxID=2014874 RepID=A0A5A5TKR5_9CHLR|nr:DUF4097 family beta strand repeat-containing protein [Dictyobacter arantiisoli]GCF11872.1 hypothetical protein KDI_54360 [Dictyobacter arantiisoli]